MITLKKLKKNLDHEKLKALGFKPIREVSSGSRKVYVSPNSRYVVKCCCLVNYPPRTHKLAKWIVYPSYRKAEWIIQRKVELDYAELAAGLICNYADLVQNDHDITSNNCGWLNGNPVCFDPIFYAES